MSEFGPDGADNDLPGIDLSGKPQSMGEQRDRAFHIMRARMVEVYARKKANVNPMVKGSMVQAYQDGVNDTFNVFAQLIEVPSDEELTAG